VFALADLPAGYDLVGITLVDHSEINTSHDL